LTANQYDSTSVRAVVRQDDRVLVEWFAPLGIYFLPGGTVEGDETLPEALLRELREELSKGDWNVGRYLGKIGHRWRKSDGSCASCLNHFYEVALIDPRLASLITAKEKDRSIVWLSLRCPAVDQLQPPSLASLLLVPNLHPSGGWNVVDDDEEQNARE
jgi:8-oxo-dGTP pyrophosphatase MutT (NUDIX family)